MFSETTMNVMRYLPTLNLVGVVLFAFVCLIWLTPAREKLENRMKT